MATHIDLQGLLPDVLVRIDPSGDLKSELSKQSLQGKTVLVYFSAHWCPPCRSFTPHLASIYAALQKRDVNAEVLFISHDRDAAQFNAYCREMAKAGGTWLAVQYAGSEGVRAELATVCGVAGIPTLVVIGPDGAVIAHNARQAVAQDATGEGYPWAGATASGGGLQMSTIALLFFVFMILPRLIDALKRWLGL